MTTPLVIGRRYLVPTVRYAWNNVMLDWPVLGPKHDDGEHLRFPTTHYHFDSRFLIGQARRVVLQYSAGEQSKDAILGAVATSKPLSVFENCDPLPDPVEKPLLCQRLSCFPTERASRSPNFLDLFAAYKGRRCGRDAGGALICPHKGVALGSLQPDKQGRVVCPLHGLVINVREGVVA